MDLQGWFDFEWVYEWAARNAGRTSRIPTFVEVGAWKGLSVSYLAMQLLHARRLPFRLYAVDTWSMDFTGTDNSALNPYLAELRGAGRTLYDVYCENIRNLGLSSDIHDLRMDSVEAAKHLGRVDFCFVDADHSADAVAEDVAAWRPKAAILAGHDADEPGVQEGLNRALGKGNWFYLPYVRCWTTHRPLFEAWEPLTKKHRTVFDRTIARIKASFEETQLCPV